LLLLALLRAEKATADHAQSLAAMEECVAEKNNRFRMVGYLSAIHRHPLNPVWDITGRS
jgi:hypothetical protein